MAVNLTNGTIIEDRFMERMAIGALFLGSSLAMLPPYAAVLYVIFSSKQIRTQPFYTIALHMGYSDLGQLLFGPGIYGGLSCLTDAYYPRSFWVKKFMNSCSFFFWFAYVSLAQVMTLNRFVTIFFPANVASLFSRRNTKILMSICWLHGLAWFVWLMMPKVNCAFSVDSYGLDYDTNPESLTALAANSYINISHSSIMVVIYSFICLKMIFEVGV
uniref:7TM GPCR serpentine receptor class x (Srx) domain-containing protein n=1 Tax=Romanomermis culicivorax TaxID=13658 RepID=A0A915KH91_ROMCU